MNGWLELESDPGLFTLLVEDFGVEGVQVEEIYDLQKPFEGPIYGFIFLFRWMEERRARRKITQDEESVVVNDGVINSMFFAQQVIPNSCATHALLSVLLNCENKVKLGPMLTQLKVFTKKMTPEDKGYAIGNMPDLAKAHNSHARPEPSHIPEKQQGLSGGRTQEAFHYVSFVSINGHLFELDGLKPYPIDHGMEKEGEDWTEMFRRVITERLGMAAGGEPTNEIRFNLMAVVPDRQVQYKQKLDTLKTNHQIVCNALNQRMKTATEEKPKKAKPESQGMMTRSARRGADANKSTESSQNFKIMKLDCQITQSLAQSEYIEDPTESGKNLAGKLLVLPGVGTGKTPKKLKPNSSIEDNDEIVENFSQKFKSEHSSSADDNLRGECEKLPISMEITADTEAGIPVEISKDQDMSKEDLSAPSPADVCSKMTGSTAYDAPPASPDVARNCVEVAMEVAKETKMEEEMDFSTVTVDDKNSLEGIIAEHQEKGSWKARVGGDKGLGSANQTLSIKDLLSLLNKVEDEMKSCENALKDEIEKRKKYKIDDCRRTHNYDEFIRTFLTMLAEQGHLANLVEQHLLTKKSRSAMPITKLKNLSKKKKKCKKKR